MPRSGPQRAALRDKSTTSSARATTTINTAVDQGSGHREGQTQQPNNLRPSQHAPYPPSPPRIRCKRNTNPKNRQMSMEYFVRQRNKPKQKFAPQSIKRRDNQENAVPFRDSLLDKESNTLWVISGNVNGLFPTSATKVNRVRTWIKELQSDLTCIQETNTHWQNVDITHFLKQC